MSGVDRESLAASVDRETGRLREQLSQIMAVSQCLERLVTGEKEETYLAILNWSTCRMLRIVKRMEVTHQLTDEDEIRLHPGLLDFGPWLKRLCGRMERLLAMSGVTLQWKAPVCMLTYADEMLLQYMLLELVDNSVKAGKNVTIELTDLDGKACLSVRDDRETMEPGQLDTLLEPDDNSEGGILLAQRIAELHGGNMLADFAPGRGLTVRVILPLREGPFTGRLKSPSEPLDSWVDQQLRVAFSDVLPQEAYLSQKRR